MTETLTSHPTAYDVVIIGGGPAGLQAALILARTRRRVLVFDSPEPPRNAASHGVHNFMGLDGMLPSEIRAQAWQQIERYQSADRRLEAVIDVAQHGDGQFLVTSDTGSTVTARHVILALGFRDIHLDIPGYAACWGNTIIGCPYCDGYENRDRVWGLVMKGAMELEHMPMIYRNWTAQVKYLVAPDVAVSKEQTESARAQGITIHRGTLAEVHHTDGKLHAVTLDTGEVVEVETLWLRPDDAPQPLMAKLIADFGLTLDANGIIQTDAFNQTSVQGLWAVGDLKGMPMALNAAYTGSQAALAITRSWFSSPHHS